MLRKTDTAPYAHTRKSMHGDIAYSTLPYGSNIHVSTSQIWCRHITIKHRQNHGQSVISTRTGRIYIIHRHTLHPPGRLRISKLRRFAKLARPLCKPSELNSKTGRETNVVKHADATTRTSQNPNGRPSLNHMSIIAVDTTRNIPAYGTIMSARSPMVNCGR